MTALDVTPTDGLLAAGGSQLLHGFVQCGSIPQAPPRQLAGAVEPIRSSEGTITDWRLTAGADTDQRVAYMQWRSNFMLERILGGVAMVRSFLRWAEHHIDVSAIRVLMLGDCRLETTSLARAEHQARRANDVLRTRGELGIGITSPQRHGLVRGFAVDDAPVLLLASGGAAVSAVREGIEVSTDGRRFLVTEWRQDGGQVIARGPDGNEDLSNSPAARLLLRVAPGCDEAHVQPVPLATIFAPLLVHIPELAHVAGSDQVPLVVVAR